MENVKVDFTNKLGVISVVTMPVNQYVASVEALPKQYSLHIDTDLTAEGAIDSAKILKQYIDSLVPSEEDQFETDEESLADLQVQLTTARNQITTLQGQLVDANSAVTSQNSQITDLQSKLTAADKTNADLTAEVADLKAQVVELTPAPELPPGNPGS